MEDFTEEFDGELVTEMATGASALLPLDPQLVEEITKGDDDPVFATYVIESGWSKSRRFWAPEMLDSIAEQINSASEPVVGYQGHVPDSMDNFHFPDIGIHWLKAKIQPSSENTRLYVKGYALPGTKARDYIKRRLARVISVSGKGTHSPVKGGVAVKEFQLESIDLARPRRSGMKTQLVSVTQEMEEGDVKPEEIAALQENELRAHNPGLVKTVEDAAKKPLEDKITEIEGDKQTADENADELSKIREALGIDKDADPLDVIAALMAKTKEQAKGVREKILAGVLAKKFKDEPVRNLVSKMLVTEMEEIDTTDESAAEKKITEMVNEKIDQDNDLKKLVEVGGGLSLGGGNVHFAGGEEGNDSDKLKPGEENAYIRVKARGKS